MSYSVRDLIAAARSVIREIGPAELLELQQFGCPIVDVREPDEFADGHLPGAVNIPRGLLEFEVDGHPAVNYQTAEALSHRQRPVVLYCLSGGRSALAAEALLRLGFVDPMSLADGILGWADAGHPVVTPATVASHASASSVATVVVATNCGWDRSNRIGLVKVALGPLSFPPATFDVVFFNEAIVHIPDKHDLMREVFRVLKPGGR